MNKFAIAALLAGTVLVPTVEAAQVVFSSPAWRDGTYGGGEFAANIIGNAANPDFYTFCLERNEGLGFGVTYNYTTSNAAEAGGVGGGPLDPISEGTAWLYMKFSNGSLGGYSFATGNPAANTARAASGRDLQDAIWALEDEQAVDGGNPFIQAVILKFGSVANAMVDYAGTQIGVMNPVDASLAVTDPFYLRQSVLINLPDNGMAVMLLGGSLMLIGAARRRLA